MRVTKSLSFSVGIDMVLRLPVAGYDKLVSEADAVAFDMIHNTIDGAVATRCDGEGAARQPRFG